jgi:hypothetical protein
MSAAIWRISSSGSRNSSSRFSSVDRSVFLRTATRAVGGGAAARSYACRLVLLDVALTNEAEGDWLLRWCREQPAAIATVP